MARLIQDVVPPATVNKLPDSDVLVGALYIRGVTIEQIFAKYFEYEQHQTEDDRILTVADAQLVSVEPLKKCEHGRVHYCSRKDCELNW